MKANEEQAELIVLPPKGTLFRFPLTKSVVKIGRSGICDLALDDDGSLSRAHAEIRQEGKLYYISDTNSSNGTHVNSNPVSGSVRLHNRDSIEIGEYEIVFKLVKAQSGAKGSGHRPTHSPEDTWDLPLTSSTQTDEDDPDRINKFLFAELRASREFLVDRPLDRILHSVLEIIFEAVGAERSYLVLMKGNADNPDILAVRLDPDIERRTQGIPFSRSVARVVITKQESILVRDALTHPLFGGSESVAGLGIRSIACVPLQRHDTAIGLLYVDCLSRKNAFSEDDVGFLTSVAKMVAAKLDTPDTVRDPPGRQKAIEIMQKLLPSRSPDLQGWELAGTNIPCFDVGGDYFDFIHGQDGRMILALADVSGKGYPSALLVATLHSFIHSEIQHEDNLCSITSRTHHYMYRSSPPEFYATFFLGSLEPATGELRYVVAGHIPPVLYRKASGAIERLMTGGSVLGLIEPTPYEEGCTRLEHGDVLVVFTDGISESGLDQGSEFGEERVGAIVQTHPKQSAQDLMETVMDEVESFSDARHPADDTTLMVVKRL